jgi:hypothetical protein
MKQTISLLLMSMLLSCGKIIEPVSFSKFFVTNATADVLLLDAANIGGGEATLLTNSVAVGAKAHIYSLAEGSGGGIAPSNVFSTFTVYAGSKAEANIIYAKVNNTDWVNEGNDADGYIVYNLTIK